MTPRGRNEARSLRGPRPARRRGDGRGLPRARRAAEARRRGQGAALVVRAGPRTPAPLRAGSAVGRRAQPPEHHVGLRARRVRGFSVHRHGAPRGRDAARAALGRRAARAQGHRLRDPGRPRAGGGAREGDRSPGPEAREPLRDERRPGQDPRLRPRQADAGRRRGRAADEPADRRRHRARRRARHARLHGARAGQGKEGRRALGHLLVRRRPLRDDLGLARLPPRVGGGDDVGDPAGGPAGPLGDQQERRAGARPRRAALPREESRGALPLGARPGVRPRGPVGDDGIDGGFGRARSTGPRARRPVCRRRRGPRGGRRPGLLPRTREGSGRAPDVPPAHLPQGRHLGRALRFRRKDDPDDRRLGRKAGRDLRQPAGEPGVAAVRCSGRRRRRRLSFGGGGRHPQGRLRHGVHALRHARARRARPEARRASCWKTSSTPTGPPTARTSRSCGS